MHHLDPLWHTCFPKSILPPGLKLNRREVVSNLQVAVNSQRDSLLRGAKVPCRVGIVFSSNII